MMPTREEIMEWRRREDALRATPLGAAFFNFKYKLTRSTVQDTEDSLTDKDRASTRRVLEEARQAEAEFRALLEQESGVATMNDVRDVLINLITDLSLRWEMNKKKTVGEMADVFLALLDEAGYKIERKRQQHGS
jgi:hypothetical protein